MPTIVQRTEIRQHLRIWHAVPVRSSIVHSSPRGTPVQEGASSGGHGILEALRVIKVLENAGIPCCVVGTSPLKNFGALDWEICLPTECLDKAFYLRSLPAQASSTLLHTFPRFKVKDPNLWFELIPLEDCYLVCEPPNFERSNMGLPYPKLEIFAQSFLDTYNVMALTDLIDAMDPSEEWGAENLDLSGTNHVEWARTEMWNDIVRSKERRINLALPKEVYVTPFRFRGSTNPRLLESDFVSPLEIGI
ncbi:hypothetical protein F5882DRAFT_431431 [Hyaloscypha sp. PMI_1271]|nr:hypothetical protein F5882DRAFT_431431 [Hyaloscypha sp. PMI_1271]